jgi:hypothetical protein
MNEKCALYLKVHSCKCKDPPVQKGIYPKIEGKPEDCKILYHGTSEWASKKILNFYLMKPGSKGMLGPGIYFAESVEDAHEKAHKNQIILSVEVKVGIQYCTWEPEKKMNKEKLAELGCNSVRWDSRSTGVEYCIFDPEQIISFRIVIGSSKTLLCQNKACVAYLTIHDPSECKLRCLKKECAYYFQAHEPPCQIKCSNHDCRYYQRLHPIDLNTCQEICKEEECQYYLQFHFEKYHMIKNRKRSGKPS